MIGTDCGKKTRCKCYDGRSCEWGLNYRQGYTCFDNKTTSLTDTARDGQQRYIDYKAKTLKNAIEMLHH